MANEKDAIVRKAKIEIDIGRSERDVKSLTSQLKELQKQLSSVQRLQNRAFESYGKTQQRHHSKVLGISSSVLSSMDNKSFEELRLKLLSQIDKVQDKLLRKQENALKKQLDLERSIQQVRESRERRTKAETSQLEKQVRLREDLNRSEKRREQTTLRWEYQQRKENEQKQEREKQQRLAAARTIFEHNQSIRAARQSDLEFAFVQNPARMGSIVSKQNAKVISELQKRQAEAEEKQRRIRNLVSEQNARAIAALQKRKAEVEEQLRRKMEEISSGGILGVAGGMFDPTLGDTVSARVRAMKANGVFGRAGRSALKRFGSQALWNIQGRIISTAYNTARAGFESAPKMEEWLAETQAIAGATSGSMNDLAKSIYEVASNSRYTTEELTRTTTVLAQAGYSAEDISKLLGSVNQLATATGTDLNRSVDLLTSSMSLWNAQTSDASKMVNALTVAVNDSKAEINSIQKGMQYAGAAASQMGMSFEETVAAMSAVTNAGLKTRSIMGTGLRALLTELSDPATKLQKELKKVGLTVSDVNVRTEGFTNVMKKLAESGFGAENAFRGMDRQAASFYLALKSQLDLNEQLIESMNRKGVAEKAEQVRMNTTVSQIKRFGSIWFEVGSTIGGPVNNAFRETLKVINDVSEGLAKWMRTLKLESKDADSVIEKSTAQIDSLKTSSRALAEETLKLSQQNLADSAFDAAKAHDTLRERFDAEGKVVRSLSRDYKELLEYSKALAVYQQNSRLDETRKRIGANLTKTRELPDEIRTSLIGLSASQGDAELQKLFSLVGIKTNKPNGKALDYELLAVLSRMNPTQLRSLLVQLGSSRLRSPMERYVSYRENLSTDVDSVQNAPTDKQLKRDLDFIYTLRDSRNEFMKGEYSKIQNNLKDWKFGNSLSGIETLLKQADVFRSHLKEFEYMEEDAKYSPEIKETLSVEKEKIFETIQSIETLISSTAESAIKDIERDVKNATQASKHEVISGIVEKLKNVIGVSKSGKGWLDGIISLLEKENGNEDLLKALKQLREKTLSSIIKIADKALEVQTKEVNAKYKVSEFEISALKAKGSHSPEAINQSELALIRVKLDAAREDLKLLKNRRTSDYSVYGDRQFEEKVNAQEELVVKLQLDEKAAIEESNRLGINGTGFWDQTGNSAKQGARDFFQNINQQSAAYSLTLEGLNSVSSGLKNAFRAIATEGVKVSDAFRQMAQSILQSLANKAIDKGVDYMMFAVGQALGFVGTATGAPGGGTSGKAKAAAGGLVTTQGIRRFAAGGGVAGRDSVPALLMPGEYVMKKSAVDMLGKETLDSLNRATSRVSDEKASNIRESKSAKPVVTNVYVVSDAKEAGMTSNDVLVTIGRDILQGGQTRQLIQQVVQGRY